MIKNTFNLINYHQIKCWNITIFCNFKDYGFKNYQNDNINKSDKLIIQQESLFKLDNHNFKDSEYSDVPTFDLILIDEVESILNHFSSSTIKDSFNTCEYLQEIITNSGNY